MFDLKWQKNGGVGRLFSIGQWWKIEEETSIKTKERIGQNAKTWRLTRSTFKVALESRKLWDV